MKPELKEIFLLLVDGVELHKGDNILKYSDPEVIVIRGRKELYCGGDLEEALAIFNAPKPNEKENGQ